MATTKAQQTERDEAIARLREWIKPGDTVYTILDHVSSSGMSRAIRVVVPYTRYRCTDCGTQHESRYAPRICSDRADGCQSQTFTAECDHLHPNHAIGKALGIRHWKRQGREQDALVVGGCGMDMGFHLVYELSHTLYGGRSCGCWRQREGATEAPYGYNDPNCPDCKGTGTRIDSGYACLGKGKCPSNYHTNHRNTIDCPGTLVYNPDGPDHGQRCYTPGGFFSRREAPEGWPRRQVTITLDSGETETIDAGALSCLTDDEGDNPIVCPTCHGEGSLPNPAGPERFDLVHTDGYAVRHRWL